MHGVVLVALALKLVWSDEFNGPANTPPDPTKWTYDLGNNYGWGNDELEIYTQSAAYQDGAGNLVIHVAQNSNGSYTSARIKTQGLFNTKYGRVEAKIKIPYGQGIWPAFWMLGEDIDINGWPDCGEIDIMENIGKEPGLIHGTVHGPGYAGDSPFTAAYALPGGAHFSGDYHVYAVSWAPDSITFSVDEHAYYRTSIRELPSGTNWVFNHPFFLLLNVAVGGAWPGYPDQTSTFPQTMLVDYVRVYAIEPGR